MRLGHRLHEVGIRDLVAEAANHRGNLRVEQRHRHHLGEVPEDLDVLARGMEDLDHLRVGHQREERREVDSLGERIDRDRLVL